VRATRGLDRRVTDRCEIQCINEDRVQAAARAMRPPAIVGQLAETFKVLGDPTRVRLAWALAQEELCVCDLAYLTGMSQSAVSHSLRALRQLRLVTYRKAGKIAYYRLDDAHVAALLRDGFRHIEATEAPHA
jgi:DNA-binding transcriptional ArsR family regulator